LLDVEVFFFCCFFLGMFCKSLFGVFFLFFLLLFIVSFFLVCVRHRSLRLGSGGPCVILCLLVLICGLWVGAVYIGFYGWWFKLFSSLRRAVFSICSLGVFFFAFFFVVFYFRVFFLCLGLCTRMRVDVLSLFVVRYCLGVLSGIRYLGFVPSSGFVGLLEVPYCSGRCFLYFAWVGVLSSFVSCVVFEDYYFGHFFSVFL